MKKITITPNKITLESGHTITKKETAWGNMFTLRNSKGYLQFETSARGDDPGKIKDCKRMAATAERWGK